MLMPDTTPAQNVQGAALERERLTSLINSMGDGVLAINEDSKVVISNGAALNILDINSTLIGKSLKDVLKVCDKNNQPIDISKVIASIKTSFSSREWHLKYPDGETISLYISIAPVRLGYGKKGARGYVLLIGDITREKSLEEERDEFISVVSHELRTPIAIAEGNISNAEFLFKKSGLKNDVINDALKQAHTQITFLSGLINDLSTLSRAERGKLDVDIESINVHELINDLANSYSAAAAAKSLEIKTELDPGLELLHSSRLYVREILQNFVTNSLKYTEHGHVTIGARSKTGGIEFFVADTGIGISKSDKEKVFDKFFRSEDYRTRANSGTGLGLYVTMKLARLLHADINLESELNEGSTFSIFIPNLN
jgi:two-component system, OmpR family, phosphate regulon sensor histidine kinase PhoR